MSDKHSKIVKFYLDPENLPMLTEEQKARLSAMRDKDIDYSDIPSQAGKEWYRPGALRRPESKQRVTHPCGHNKKR